MLIIQQSIQNEITIFSLEGRLDASTVPSLEEAFYCAFNQGKRRFIWECSRLEYLSSVGLRVFLQAIKQLDQIEGRLVVASAQSSVIDIFDISGFKSMIELKPDLPSALSACEKGC